MTLFLTSFTIKIFDYHIYTAFENKEQMLKMISTEDEQSRGMGNETNAAGKLPSVCADTNALEFQITITPIPQE